MRQNRFDQAPAQSLTATRCDDEHVGQIAESRSIRHDARKPDLTFRLVQSEAQRMGDRALHNIARHGLRPVRILEERSMDQHPGELRPIGRDAVGGRWLQNLTLALKYSATTTRD